MLNKCSEMYRPFRLNTDDVNVELETHRVTPRKMTKYRLRTGLGAKIAEKYFAYWDRIESSTWEHEHAVEEDPVQ